MTRAITLFIFAFSISSVMAETWPGKSLFNLSGDFTRHDGKKVKLSSLQDSPKIVSMVFLRCSYSCPITLQDMRQMEAKVAEKAKASFGMVLISIDPENDTPEAMRKFAVERKLDLKRWTILTASHEDIRKLAAAFGFSYKKDEAMEFAHSMLTWVLDTKGVVTFERVGQKQSIQDTSDELLKLINVK